MRRLVEAAKAYIADLVDHEGAEGFSESTAALEKEWQAALAVYGNSPDLWTKNVEDLRGDMFFWAHPNNRGGWSIGVGYWCKDGGWAGSEFGRTGNEHLAIRFHPFPDPPKS